MASNIPLTYAAQVLRREREVLAARRQELVASLDAQIAELDAALVEVSGSVAQRELSVFREAAAEASSEVAAAQFTTKAITATLEALLKAGVTATTDAIREALAANGVKMPPDANFRITKALSRTGRFKGNRTSGWTPKNTSWQLPGGVGPLDPVEDLS